MKRYLYAAIVLLMLIPAAVYMGSTFAWFVDEPEQGNPAGEIGVIQVNIQQYDSEVSGSSEFTLVNTGTLSAYVRVGYTFIYRDDKGNDLVDDVKGVTTKNYRMSIDNEQLQDKPLHVENITVPREVGGYTYEKPFLIPLDPDNKAYYYMLQPGETLKGSLDVIQATEPDKGKSLHIVWVAEALQAKKNAVKAAEGYGWDVSKAAG